MENNGFDMNLSLKRDSEFREMMNSTKEMIEFVMEKYPDQTDEEQMNISRDLFIEGKES